MAGLALALLLLGTLALAGVARLATGPLVVGAALSAGVFYVGPSARAWLVDGWVQTWNLYHYTIGARFFGELGYDGLYVATLEADREHTDRFRHVATVRDLTSYQKVSRATAEAGWDVDAHLSPERRDELDRAVGALHAADPGQFWFDVFVDRGYNASPAYTAVAAPLAAALPAEDPLGRRLCTALDPALLAAGLGCLALAFDVPTLCLVLLCLALFPGTDGRWAGGFLEYDWLAALMVAAAAVKAERPGAAGLALAWATASRLFPAALAVSLLLPELRASLAARRPTRFGARFLAAFLGGLALAALLGCATARGPSAWLEFVPRILFHAEQHALGDQRIGWRHLLLLGTDEDLRAATLQALAPVAWTVATLGIAVQAWRASVRGRSEALQLGWVTVFLATVASRYYWAGLALAPTVPGTRGRWLALWFGGTRVAFEAARLAGLDAHGVYLAIEAWIAVGLVVWLAASDRAGAEGAPRRGTPVGGDRLG